MRYTYGVNKYNTINSVYIPSEQRDTEWFDYLDFLEAFAGKCRLPSEKDRVTPWTAPFLIPPGSRRAKENVIGCSAFASVDLDTKGWTIDRLNDRLHGFARCYYTTTQSRAASQRWRVIVRLDREITARWDSAADCWHGEYVSIWQFINDVLDGELDAKTCNANRILYVPAQWMWADNVFVRYDGMSLPVDDVLALRPVKPLPMMQPVGIGDLKKAPDGTEIITNRMIDQFRSSTKGGRYIHMLGAAAARFKAEGWELTANELDAAAMAAVGKHDNDHLREAERAIAWAERGIETESPWRRFQQKLRHGLRK